MRKKKNLLVMFSLMVPQLRTLMRRISSTEWNIHLTMIMKQRKKVLTLLEGLAMSYLMEKMVMTRAETPVMIHIIPETRKLVGPPQIASMRN
jgi:hypothetical protein